MEEDRFLVGKQTFVGPVRFKGKLELVFAGKVNRRCLSKITSRVVLAGDVQPLVRLLSTTLAPTHHVSSFPVKDPLP